MKITLNFFLFWSSQQHMSHEITTTRTKRFFTQKDKRFTVQVARALKMLYLC